jgi:hypothetical protein
MNPIMENTAKEQAKIRHKALIDYLNGIDARLDGNRKNAKKLLARSTVNRILLHDLEIEESNRVTMGAIIFVLGLFIWAVQLLRRIDYGQVTNATMIIAATFLICYATYLISFPKKITEFLKNFNFPGIPFKDNASKK